LQFVADDPGRYLRLSLSRIPIYFQFWPTPHSSLLSNAARLFSFGLFLPFMLYGLLLSLRRARQNPPFPQATAPPTLHLPFLTLLWLYMGLYTAIHIASWANVRYRLPVDAILLLFAGLALATLWQQITSARSNVQTFKRSNVLTR